MTENHHQDKEMLDEIERVLNHQASENELLTTLSKTSPKARASFQHTLEETLVAQLTQTTQEQETGDKFMKLFDEKSKRKSTPSRLPFTLVAAILAIVLIGGLIFVTSLNDTFEPYADTVPENFALTATQLINDAIATGGTSTIGILEPVTSTPSATFTATATPANFRLTATALIEDVTATALAENTTQQIRATAIPDAFMLTATAIIEDATATAIANSEENLSNNIGRDNCRYSGLVENYIISEGDTLFSIAQSFEVSAETIMTANCFDDSVSIQIGQVLQIPIETVPVVIAVQDIPEGTEITASHVMTINFPASARPSNVFSNVEDVIGLIAQTTLRGEGAIRTYLVADTYSQAFGRIVVARRDIELNEVITDEMVTTVQYDIEDVWAMPENNRGSFYYSNKGVVIGQRASTFIPQHNPITSNNVTEAQNCHDEVAICAPTEGYVVIGISTADRTTLAMPLGSRVDAITALQYVDIGDEAQAIVDTESLPSDIVPSVMINTIVNNAILLNVQDEGDTVTVSLALLPQDSITLLNLLEADIPLRFVPHVDQFEPPLTSLNFSRDYPLTDDGLAIVSIPLSQINTDTVVNVGDTFNIQFSILPSEADLLSAMPTPQAGDVFNWDRNSPYDVTILEIEDSNVLYVGRDTEDYPNPAEDNSLFMAITVNPDEAWIVDWYARNGANFTIDP